MTNCSNTNFSIDVPISLVLQLDVVGISDVWECTGSSLPLAVLQRRAGELPSRSQAWVSVFGP